MSKITKLESLVPQAVKRARVAAYTRVSADGHMPLHSLSAQVSYYSTLIQRNPEWEYVGVYADQGISGRTIEKRDGFQKLIRDCDAGKIDIILVKSISRFARNTVDLLETIRHLRDIGVEVRFDRENISTSSADGELLITLLASFAQEESRSLSENIKWAIRKRFEQGIPNGHKAPYGYEWDGEMFRIIPEQGKVVKEIYRRYLSGESAHAVAKSLAAEGVVGQAGAPIEVTTVKNILSSFSYTGTMILQKSYLTDGHKRRTNKGELPRYAVEEMFEPLVSTEDFEKVQEIMRRRADSMPNRNPTLTAFSGIMKCGQCGSSVCRRTGPNGKKWVCNTRERKGMNICGSRPIRETELMDAAVQALGTGTYDEDVVRMEVKQVTIYGDRIEFHLKNGRIKQIVRKYGGFKMRGAFSGKIRCGICGCVCQSNTWRFGPAGQKMKTKVWICAAPRKSCNLRRIMDDELREAAEFYLARDYEARFVEEIGSVIADNKKLDFIFKDGTVKTWQRK